MRSIHRDSKIIFIIDQIISKQHMYREFRTFNQYMCNTFTIHAQSSEHLINTCAIHVQYMYRVQNI